MKYSRIIFYLLIGFTNVAYSQTMTVLNKNETYKASTNGTIVMDKFTFGKLSYTSSQCDTLKQQVKTLDSLIVHYDSTQQAMVNEYESLIHNQEQQIQSYEQGYTRMKNTVDKSLEQQNQLQLRLNTLEQKHHRTRFWRNVFIGTSALLGGMLYLSIAH